MSLISLRNHKIILASQSPRRKKLLKVLNLKFKAVNPDVEEKIEKNESPEHYAKRVAIDKALVVSKKFDDRIIISADTIVLLNNKILNKPLDKKDAFRMLKFLSNKTHQVFTAVCIINQINKKILCEVEKTKVQFKELSDKEIKEYIASGSCMDKAGSYGIQEDFGAVFVKKIDGCYYNVVGLPLYLTYQMLLKVTK